MAALNSKLAVVTGASSGIGAAIVKELLLAGAIVVGLARRFERIEEIAEELTVDQKERLHAYKCDVSDAVEVATIFEEITAKHGPLQILINNAGCVKTGQLCTQPVEEVQRVLQTNVMGVVNCTREAFAVMQANNNGEGQIILINSITGHRVVSLPGQLPNLNIYPATKYAITAMNEIYRQEFRELGTRIKVTSISPGLVDTELVPERMKTAVGIKILESVDIAKAVMFVLTAPAHVHVYEMIIKPAGDII